MSDRSMNLFKSALFQCSLCYNPNRQNMNYLHTKNERVHYVHYSNKATSSFKYIQLIYPTSQPLHPVRSHQNKWTPLSVERRSRQTGEVGCNLQPDLRPHRCENYDRTSFSPYGLLHVTQKAIRGERPCRSDLL